MYGVMFYNNSNGSFKFSIKVYQGYYKQSLESKLSYLSTCHLHNKCFISPKTFRAADHPVLSERL